MKNKIVIAAVITFYLSGACLIGFLLIGSKSTQINAVDIYLNGSKIKISTIYDKGTLYVPIDGICRYFNCDYIKDDDKKIINFIKSRTSKEMSDIIDTNWKDKDILMEKSGYKTMIDGILLFITPHVYDKKYYIPLMYFAESFEKNVEWDLFKTSLSITDYPHKYVGSVNGEKIKKRFFNERYISKSGRSAAGTAGKNAKGRQGKKKISREEKLNLEEEVFGEIVEMMLARQKAPESGLIIDENIKTQINNYLIMTVNRSGGIENFREKARKNGVTYQDAVNYFTYGVIKESVMEKITAKAEPPEEMMRAYYDNSPKSFIKPARAIVKHIILPTKDKDEKSFGNEKVEEQKKLANMILENIRNGEDFEALRQKYSQDHYPDTYNHPNGFEVIEGYLSIAKVFEDEVFKLKPGETSGIVKTYRGFHIIKLVSKSEKKQKSFEESKEKIKSDLAYTAKINYMAELMRKWINESDIEKQL